MYNFMIYIPLHIRVIKIINPRRACTARVTVVSCMYVCVSVCLSAHAILAVYAIKSIMKDTIWHHIKHRICSNIN